MGHVRCADCGKIIELYFDGFDWRVSKHDVCGMGGQLLLVQERARQANLRAKRETRS